MSKIIWHCQHPVLDAALELISGAPKDAAMTAWLEAQALVLERVSAHCATIRAETREPSLREEAYAEVWTKARRDLFRHLWSQFSEVRKVFFSSVLENNQVFDLPPPRAAKPRATPPAYLPALFS